MANQRRQELPRLGMVLSHLAAAEGMGKGIESVDAAGDKMLILLHQRGRDAVDAAHDGDDPELVAHGGAPVLAAVALKRSGLCLGQRKRPVLIGIVRALAEPGPYVMDMDPGSRRDLRFCNADRIAVFDDSFPFGNHVQRDFVPAGDVL